MVSWADEVEGEHGGWYISERWSVEFRANGASGRIVDFAMKPGFCVGPESFGGALLELEGLGCLFHRHAYEVAELDQLGDLGVFSLELGKGLVYGEQLLRWGVDNNQWFDGVEFDLGDAGPSFLTVLLPGVVDQDSPHRLGGGSEEVITVFPAGARAAIESKPRLVDEGCSLEGMARPLAGHFAVGQSA